MATVRSVLAFTIYFLGIMHLVFFLIVGIVVTIGFPLLSCHDKNLCDKMSNFLKSYHQLTWIQFSCFNFGQYGFRTLQKCFFYIFSCFSTSLTKYKVVLLSKPDKKLANFNILKEFLW